MSLPKKFIENTAPEIRSLLNTDEFIGLLARTTIFRGIPVERVPLADLEEIARKIDIKHIPENKSLPSRHDTLYEIISGYVKIYEQASPPREKGKKKERIPRALLAWRVPGELLGDFRFALPGEKISDDIVTTDKCRLLIIPTATIHDLAKRYSRIYFNIASNLAAKANKSRIRAQILRLSDVEPKIARLFFELRKERGYDKEIFVKDNLKVVNGTFRNADIGAFLGYGRRSITDGIQALIKEELIDHYTSVSSGRFVIRDEPKLLEYLGLEPDKVPQQK